MRVLVTGASGFAGGWLARACASAGETVIGVSRRGVSPAGEGVACDLTDAAAVRSLVASVRPDVVYHLAALSSVGRSWSDPARALASNVGGAVSLLEAVRFEAPAARMVWVSSCEVYGSGQTLPIDESRAVPRPESPYAVSKLAAEQLAGVYSSAYGLDVVVARPFSHAGPGQLPIYLLSNLAREGARARARGGATVRIATGNPSTRRDFTDVRDVVRAYRLLAASSCAGVFNVCSGSSVSAADQVALLSELIAPIEVEHVVDPALVRASEIMELRGSGARVRDAVGWEPSIPLRQTMAETIQWWEQELRN